jgi:hypothetical protein
MRVIPTPSAQMSGFRQSLGNNGQQDGQRRMKEMALPKDSFQHDIRESVVENWRMFLRNMEASLDRVEEDINEASTLAGVCTSEWCEATEHVIDELGNQLFSISEPRWASEEDSRKLKALKRRVHDLYANYTQVYQKAASA